jgi:hypothetical protein
MQRLEASILERRAAAKKSPEFQHNFSTIAGELVMP